MGLFLTGRVIKQHSEELSFNPIQLYNLAVVLGMKTQGALQDQRVAQKHAPVITVF